MIKTLKNLYLSQKIFWAGGIVVALFVLSFTLTFLFPIAKTALALITALLLVDIVFLFKQELKVACQRKLPKMLSLGSDNEVLIQVENQSSFTLRFHVFEELPFQFQERNIKFSKQLNSGDKQVFTYVVVPKTRGKYGFGKVHLYIQTVLGLAERRYSYDLEEEIPVYPSVKEMKLLQLNTFSNTSNALGVKKIRRLGHTYEFDQIKSYVNGDDYSSINWKASSRNNSLMVNHYEDEKSQQVYSLIDKSRAMLMPFNGMSLLDYAINTSLVIANTVLNKYDKAGLVTFSDKINSTLKASKSHKQLKLILETLYNEKENNLEANYERLYIAVKNLVRGRSLLLLFTNFESKYALERVLPTLRKLNKLHLLVVIFFENTEIVEYKESSAKNLEDIYFKTIAGKFIAEKNQIAFQLKQYGIQTLVTKPEHLSVNTVNKYLELKSRGLI